MKTERKRETDLVLKVIAQVSLYAIKVVAIWIFLRGHQLPGGGFVAGLVISAAIALQGVAFGHRAAQAIIPWPFQRLLGTGLTIAASTVIGPILLGYDPMKHAFGHFYVPILGDLEWATAALFDLGVFLVVIGSAKAILLFISEGDPA